ncbi:MAG: hypothetical protein ACT4OU_10570 [Hyphomicrobium sp.]
MTAAPATAAVTHYFFFFAAFLAGDFFAAFLAALAIFDRPSVFGSLTTISRSPTRRESSRNHIDEIQVNAQTKFDVC